MSELNTDAEQPEALPEGANTMSSSPSDPTFATPPPAPALAPHPGDTHPINVAHLVMGLAFLGLVFLWFGVEFAQVSSTDLRWLVPLPWLVAGIGGLAAITASRRRSPR